MKKFLIALFVILLVGGIGYIVSRMNKTDEDKLAKVLPEKIMFNGEEVDINDALNFNPGNSCAGDIKAVLTTINEDSIVLEVLEEQAPNGNFLPSDRGILQIEDKTCVEAYPLCLDVVYSYCFDVNTLSITPSYTYKLESRSTLPRPL